MLKIIITTIILTLTSITEPTLAYVEPCGGGICCEWCRPGSDGITNCGGCFQGSTAAECSGDYLSCEPSQCYNGGNNCQYGSFGNECCE